VSILHDVIDVDHTAQIRWHPSEHSVTKQGSRSSQEQLESCRIAPYSSVNHRQVRFVRLHYGRRRSKTGVERLTQYLIVPKRPFR
jgi:hypothetical protein